MNLGSRKLKALTPARESCRVERSLLSVQASRPGHSTPLTPRHLVDRGSHLQSEALSRGFFNGPPSSLRPRVASPSRWVIPKDIKNFSIVGCDSRVRELRYRSCPSSFLCSTIYFAYNSLQITWLTLTLCAPAIVQGELGVGREGHGSYHNKRHRSKSEGPLKETPEIASRAILRCGQLEESIVPFLSLGALTSDRVSRRNWP